MIKKTRQRRRRWSRRKEENEGGREGRGEEETRERWKR